MCRMHENTLSSLPGVESIEDCRVACRDQPQCTFLTYFAADRFEMIKWLCKSPTLDFLTFRLLVSPFLRLASSSPPATRCWTAWSAPRRPTPARRRRSCAAAPWRASLARTSWSSSRTWRARRLAWTPAPRTPTAPSTPTIGCSKTGKLPMSDVIAVNVTFHILAPASCSPTLKELSSHVSTAGHPQFLLSHSGFSIAGE